MPRPTTGSGPRARLAVCLVVTAALLMVPTAADAQAIAVTLSDGLGRVTSDPPGIDCPGTCTAPFAADNDVTLIATPAPGYAFGVPDEQGDPVDKSGWQFGCEEVPGDPLRCTVDVLPSGETEVDAAFRPAALLLVVANGGGGSVTATVSNPQVGETGQQTCNSDQRGGVVCPFPYVPGRAVTLTPSPFAAPFPIWSDDDCLDAAPCTLVLDELRRSITATFATQNVFVRVNGPGRVFSTPAGLDCTFAEDEVPADCPDEGTASFRTGEEVTLTAVGTTPVWETDPSPTRAGCDSTDGAVCRVVAERTRWAAVEFAGAQNDGQYPPRASARFRARKAGDGSGTVSGSGINCGSRCSVETSYGERFVLVADASPGSRFVRWRRGCGTRPRCALTVGPITRVTAVFEAVARAATVPPPTITTVPPPTITTLRAVLNRVRVRRVRGGFRLGLALRTNLAAKVGARVTRRGRTVARRSWQVRAGHRRLAMRVRARRGRYRLIVAVRSADGQVQRINRKLRLR
jgi:hypothetical protein